MKYLNNKTIALLILTFSFVSLMHAVTQERTDLAKYVPMGLKERLFWKNLYTPRQRDQLYEPVALSSHLYKDQGLTVFFSRAGKLAYGVKDVFDMVVARNLIKEALESVLKPDDVEDPDETYPDGPDGEEEEDNYSALQEAFADSINNKAETISTSIHDYASLMTFQEHRIGLSLAKEWVKGRWSGGVRTWLGMAERNYWLGAQERTDIAALMKTSFPQMDGGKMKIKDFLAMRWGLGDTHLKFGYTLPLTNTIDLTSGVRAVLPTGRKVLRPTKNRLMPLETMPLLTYIRQRMNEVLIEPHLGNNGHYGVGTWFEATWNRIFVTDRNKLSVRAYGGLDYLLPTSEERFFVHKKTTFPNNLINLFKTDDSALRSYLNQYAIPEPISVVVAPGVVAQVGVVANMRFDKTAIFAGYDFYYKDEEKFDRFVYANKADAFLLRQKDFGGGSDGAELRNSQHQHKLQLGMTHSKTYRDIEVFSYRFRRLDVSLSLHGATSLGSKNMGDDFILGFSAGWRC